MAEAVEPYGLAWLEDPMPWWDIDGHKEVTDAITVPTAAGEELYLWDGFRELIEQRAVDIIHPDLLTSGGMLETKRIADYARALRAAHRAALRRLADRASWPMSTAPRRSRASSPSSTTASTCPSGASLVTGLPERLHGRWLRGGAGQAGAGRRPQLEAHRGQSALPGLFEPTEEWNTPKLGFWRPDRRWDPDE